jgi:hypothetical protein
LDRDSDRYKQVYRQRTAVERINSQAVALGIERPHLRHGSAIANQNTLIYLLINLRFLQRLRGQSAARLGHQYPPHLLKQKCVWFVLTHHSTFAKLCLSIHAAIPG